MKKIFSAENIRIFIFFYVYAVFSTPQALPLGWDIEGFQPSLDFIEKNVALSRLRVQSKSACTHIHPLCVLCENLCELCGKYPMIVRTELIISHL